MRFFGGMAGLSLVSESEIKKSHYDMAIICSPPKFHQSNYELVKTNAEKIFLEKPGLVNAPGERNLYVGYVLRHAPCVAKLIDSVGGRKLKSLNVDIRSNTVMEDGTGWRASSYGGGVINEFGSHAINLAKLIVGSEYRITRSEASKVVSSGCPDICNIEGVSKNGVEVKIDLNWSDASVRKPVYKIVAVLEDDTEVHTALYQIWNVGKDKKKSDISGVAYWPSRSKFYLRGLEFSEQTKYFVDQHDFLIDLEDSSFTDNVLKEIS